jgi:hypothetical protein
MRTWIPIAALCLAASAAPAAAQTAAPPLGYKDPGTATLIGVVVPGGGQLYAGETKKGLILLGTGVGGLVLGTAMTTNSVSASCDEDLSCEDDTNYLPMAVGYLAFLGSWVYGIIDADDSATRMNAQRGLGVLPEGVTPLVAPVGDGTGVGISIRI